MRVPVGFNSAGDDLEEPRASDRTMSTHVLVQGMNEQDGEGAIDDYKLYITFGRHVILSEPSPFQDVQQDKGIACLA